MFVSVNQRVNQMSDRASIVRSRYYQEKYRAAKKKAEKRWSVSEEDWFDAFCEQERVVFQSGWRHTFLGRIAALPWTFRDPPEGANGSGSVEMEEHRVDGDGEDGGERGGGDQVETEAKEEQGGAAAAMTAARSERNGRTGRRCVSAERSRLARMFRVSTVGLILRAPFLSLRPPPTRFPQLSVAVALTPSYTSHTAATISAYCR